MKELRALFLDGLHIQVGGQIASQLDTIQAVQERFPLVLIIIMAVTFTVLCVLLNSVILPLKAIFINLLSIGASFGALVFIFQMGNFMMTLHFTPLGYLDRDTQDDPDICCLAAENVEYQLKHFMMAIKGNHHDQNVKSQLKQSSDFG